MNDQTLDAAAAIPINGIWIIPLKADIVKLFGTNQIQFQISIKDNSIVLESPKILEDTDNQDKPVIKEAINVY